MWKTVKLGDVCDFQGGSQPPKKEFVFEQQEGYVRFLQIRDFKSDKNVTYIPISKKNRLSNTDDILIGRYGASVGQILRGLKGAYNVALMKTIPNEQLISKGWLYAYLNSPLFQKPLMEVSSRSAQNGFSRDDISAFELPVPPLAEQQRIVAKLDAAFAEIDRAIDHTKEKQKAIEDLTSTTKKNFLEAEMSGAMTLLGESCEFFNGKAHEKDIDDQGKYVVVNSKFISSDGTVKKYTNEQMFPLSQGDIVMVMSDVPKGKALAKTYLIEEGDKYSLNQRICCIRSTNYDAKYLKTIIDRNPHFLKRDNGENQTNLRKADILSCPLPVTTEETQEEREKFLSSLTADLKSILLLKQRIIDEYIKLKSAILSQELQPPQSEAA
jgi:type I restriction enzyme S subunit